MISHMDILQNDMIGSDHHPIMVAFHTPSTCPCISLHNIPQSPAPIVDEEMEHKYDEPAPLTIVTPSTIPGGGRGLFANRDIMPGDVIGEYTGEILTETQKQHRYPNNEAQYVMYVKRDMYIDAVDEGKSSNCRYINTGGKLNNARPRPYYRNGQSGVKIIATKRIYKGEEIFMPYGSTFRSFTFTPPPPRPTRPRPHPAPISRRAR